jgi:hypothetical protein
MSKVTFYGTPAWVGAIQGPTICEWWSSDPAQLNWDRSLLNTVDLSMTPSAAIAGRIKVSQIDVDDYTGNGGRTTIGPVFPSGSQIGACWVSDKYLARSGGRARAATPSGGAGHIYEYMTIQYFDDEQDNRRFHGFHAKVLQVNGGISLVQVWSPGTGAGTAPPAGAWWLNLSSDADPNTPPLAVNVPGALFLELKTVRQLTTFDTKLPPYHGAFAI